MGKERERKGSRWRWISSGMLTDASMLLQRRFKKIKKNQRQSSVICGQLYILHAVFLHSVRVSLANDKPSCPEGNFLTCLLCQCSILMPKLILFGIKTSAKMVRASNPNARLVCNLQSKDLIWPSTSPTEAFSPKWPLALILIEPILFPQE